MKFSIQYASGDRESLENANCWEVARIDRETMYESTEGVRVKREERGDEFRKTWMNESFVAVLARHVTSPH